MSQYTIAIIKMALMAMLPIIELKGAIPIGMVMGVPPWVAFWICFFFSSLPTPFILWLLHKVIDYAKRFDKIDKFFTWFVESSVKKSKTIQKYMYWGLFIFVAIPLPGTGIWTGATIASVFEFDRFKSMICIVAGNLVAGLIIFGLSMMGYIALT